MKRVTAWVFGLIMMSVAGTAAAQTPPPAMQDLDRALLAYQEQADGAVAAKSAELLRDGRTPVLGNPEGVVPVIEFFDYQCPYCKAIEPKLENLIKADTHVKLVIKEFPILGPVSVVATKAALASVYQGKYAAYHQAMMAFHGQLTVDQVFAMAKDVGLDVDRLRKDMDSPQVADQIIANMNLARALKISVTPAVIVGTHIYAGLSNQTSSGKIDFEQAVALAKRAP